MRRDFTEATRRELLKYIDDMSQESIWEKVWEGIRAFVSFQWLRILDSVDTAGEAQIKAYHKELVDAKNYSKKQINKIFEEANAKDRRDAPKLSSDCEFAAKLLKELDALTDIISPTGSLKNISTFKGSLEALEEASPLAIEDGKLVYKIEPITEEEIVAHAMGNPGDDYHNIHRNVSDALSTMGLGTILCIALFNHKDINMQSIINSSDGRILYDYVKAEIIKGREGYDSIKSIAEKLGVEEDYVKYLLNVPGSMLLSKNFNRYNRNGLNYKTQIQNIIYANVNKAMKDPEFIKDMCESAGLDPELTQLMIDEGGVDGYEFSQYKKLVAESVAAACKTYEDFDLKSEAKNYVDIVDGIMDLAKGDELGPIIEAWGKGELTSDEASKFLEDCCGMDNVLDTDIETLNSVFELFDKFGDLKKISKYAGLGAKTWAHLAENYDSEISLLNTMIDSAEDNAAYKAALLDLKAEYENKWYKVLNDIGSQAAGYAVGKAKDLVPLLSLAETAIDVAGQLTGAEGYASAAQEIIGLSSIVPKTVDTYYEALERVSDGNYDEKDIADVRLSFEMMKQSSINYYEAQITYAQGVIRGSSGYDSYIDYLEDELSRIEKMQIGSEYKPRTYEAYLEQ